VTLAILAAAIVGLMAIMSIAWWIHRKTGNAGWIDAI
jgi:steroid 5-alpha reductase family enzyme